jgi:hypothetical protein
MLYGQGGLLHLDVPSRPSNALVSGYTGDGAAVFASRTCNVSSVNTTLGNSASKGDSAINVASNTGLAQGVRCWVQDDPEEVTVRAVSNGTIYLRRPLIRDHVSGALVEGTRVAYQANATDAGALFWDGHIDWNLAGQVAHQSTFECTRYLATRVATVQDLEDEDSNFYNLMDPKMDIEQMLDLAHEDVLKHVAAASPDGRVRVAPSSREFVQATVFAFFWRLYRPRTNTQELAKSYASALVDEVKRVVAAIPRDSDQDGVVESTDKITIGTIRLRH